MSVDPGYDPLLDGPQDAPSGKQRDIYHPGRYTPAEARWQNRQAAELFAQYGTKKARAFTLSPQQVAFTLSSANAARARAIANSTLIANNRAAYEATAARLDSIGNNYPTIPGDAAYALAASGKGSFDPATQAAANLSATYANLAPLVSDRMTTITPDNAATFAEINPNMSDEELMASLTEKGYHPADAAGFSWTGSKFVSLSDSSVSVDLRAVLKAQQDNINADSGGALSNIFGDIYGGVKWFARGTFATVTVPWEAYSGAVRENVNDITNGQAQDASNWDKLAAIGGGFIGMGWDESWDETTFAEASRELWHHGGMHAGTGWFMGGTVSATKTARDIAWYANQMADGSPGSPGRFLASTVLDAGSEPYRLVSGLVDATGALALDPSTYIPAGLFAQALRAGPKALGLARAVQPVRWSQELTHVHVPHDPGGELDTAASIVPDPTQPRPPGFGTVKQTPRSADQAVLAGQLAPKWYMGGNRGDRSIGFILGGRKVNPDASVKLRSRRFLDGKQDEVRMEFDPDGLTGFIDTNPANDWAGEIHPSNGGSYTSHFVPVDQTLADMRARVRNITVSTELDPNSSLATQLKQLVDREGWNVTTRNRPNYVDGEIVGHTPTTTYHRPDQIVPNLESRLSPFVEVYDSVTGEIRNTVRPGLDSLDAPLGNLAETVSADLSVGTFLTQFDEVAPRRTRELFDRKPIQGVSHPDMLEEVPPHEGFRVQWATDQLEGGVDTKRGGVGRIQAANGGKPLGDYAPVRAHLPPFDEEAATKKIADEAYAQSEKFANSRAYKAEQKKAAKETIESGWSDVTGGAMNLTPAEWNKAINEGVYPVDWFINLNAEPGDLGAVLRHGYTGVGAQTNSKAARELSDEDGFFNFLSSHGITKEMYDEAKRTGAQLKVPKMKAKDFKKRPSTKDPLSGKMERIPGQDRKRYFSPGDGPVEPSSVVNQHEQDLFDGIERFAQEEAARLGADHTAAREAQVFGDLSGRMDTLWEKSVVRDTPAVYEQMMKVERAMQDRDVDLALEEYAKLGTLQTPVTRSVKVMKEEWSPTRFGIKFSGKQTTLYRQMRTIDAPTVRPPAWSEKHWKAWAAQRKRLLDRGWVLEETPHGREVLRKPMAGEYDAAANTVIHDTLAKGDMSTDAGVEAGLIENGHRRITVPEKFYQWWVSEKTLPIRQYLVDATDPEAVMKAIGPQKTTVLRDIIAAKTVDEVTNAVLVGVDAKAVQRVAVQGGSAKKLGEVADSISNHVPGFRKSTDDIRLFHVMPGQYADLGDADKSFQTLLNWLHSAKIPRADRNVILNQILTQQTSFGRKEVYFSAFQVIRGALAHHLMKSWKAFPERTAAEADKMAHELVTLFEKEWSRDAAYAAADTSGTVVGSAISAGQDLATHNPMLLGEYFDGLLPLPNPRDIIRLTGALGRMSAAGLDMSEKGGLDKVIRALDGYNTFFKVAALARIAYPLRVLMEEQGRLYAAGYPNIYTHPIQFVMDAVKGNRGHDILGNYWKDMGADPNPNQWADAQINARLLLDNDNSVKFLGKNFQPVNESHPDYLKGWMFGLGKYHTDPVARRILGGYTVDELSLMPQAVAESDNITKVVWWLTNHEEKGLDYLRSLREASRKSYPEFSAELMTTDGVTKWVQEVADHVRYMTAQGNEELEKVILHGKITVDGKVEHLFRDPTVGKGGQVWNFSGKPNSGFTHLLANFLDVETKPGVVITPTGVVTKQDLSGWDKSVSFIFSVLNSRPSNYLSRGPLFRQHYYDQLPEYLTIATDQAVAKIMKNAENMTLTRAQRKAMEKAVANRDPKFTHLSAEDVDNLAKNDALDRVRELLYETSDRTHFWDAMRIAAPFGAAWAEVMSTWVRMIGENPRVLDRVAHGIHGAQMEGSNIIYDTLNMTHPADQGFFFKDIETGQESFAWPMPSIAQKSLLWGTAASGMNPGVTFPAPVAGLNLIGQVQPGFGPVVTAAAELFLSGGKAWQEDLKNFIAPFGGPSPEGSGGLANALLDSVTPAWVRKLIVGVYPNTPEQKSQLAAATTSSMIYLSSTKRYDMGSDEGRTALLEDAQSMAHRLYMLRAVSQFVLPTLGSPDQAAMTGNGELVMQSKLAEILRSYTLDPGEGGYGYQEGLLHFLRDYGSELYLMGVSRTSSTGYMTPTRETYTWMKNNTSLTHKYPKVWGFLVDDPGTEFYFPAYQAQVRQGFRTLNPPTDLVLAANSRLATARYQSYRDQMGDNPTEEEAAQLSQIQSSLEAQFPGYSRMPESFGDTAGKILQLQEAAGDSRVKSTPVGQALGQYFAARTQYRNMGVTSFRTEAGRDYAYELHALGESLASQNVAFAAAWDRLLSYEFDSAQFSQEAA